MDEARRERFEWFHHIEFATLCRSLYLIFGDREAASAIGRDAFARAYEHWGRVDRSQRSELWVRRVAIKRAIRQERRHRFRARLLPRIEAPVIEKPSRHAELWTALQELPRSQRIAIVLFYFEDRGASDIAEITRSSEPAVKAQLKRAQRRFGELLDEVVDVAR